MKLRLFAFLALILCVSSLFDLQVARFFYHSETGFYDNAFFHGLFLYGELFGFICGGVALLIGLLSFIQPRLHGYRRACLALLLTLVLGAGVITNSVLKQYWGRPRPKQLIEFGGAAEFRPFWKPDFRHALDTTQEPQRSFPSGHAAMGWYFLSLFWTGKRMQNRFLMLLGLGMALFLGGSLMVARVVQGGHFVSDVVASFLLMTMLSYAINCWVISIIPPDRAQNPQGSASVSPQSDVSKKGTS